MIYLLKKFKNFYIGFLKFRAGAVIFIVGSAKPHQNQTAPQRAIFLKLLLKIIWYISILSLALTLTPLALAGSFSLLSPFTTPFTSPLQCLALLTNPGLVWQPVSLYFVTGFTLLVEPGVRLALMGDARAPAAFLGVPRAPTASAAARRGVP